MEQEKRATWLELFYDLAYAALVAQLTYSVASHHTSWADVLTIILVSYAIFIVWIGTTVNRNLGDSESRLDKLIVQVQVVGALTMSVYLPRVFDGDWRMFLISFVALKSVQLAVTAWSYHTKPNDAPKTKNVLQGRIVATVFWLVAAFVAMPYVYILATMGMITDLLSPQTKGKGNAITYLNVSHLQERLGLFLLMVMGESVLIVSLTNTAVQFGVSHPVIVIAGVLMMLGLWWAYFHHLESCGEGKRPKNMFVYLNAHSWLYASLVLFAAAFKNLIKHDHLYMSDLYLLMAGLLIMGLSLIVIRLMLRATTKAMTSALGVMVLGLPVMGYIGYVHHSQVVLVMLVTIWMLLWVMVDEYKRKKFFKS